MATARAIGVYPTWRVLTEAELLHEYVKEIERKLSLESAVREAIDANLDLAVENRIVAAGEQSVKQARSVLLPQIDLDAGGVIIDEDRAGAGFGTQPERSLSGGATARQLIYSEDAWSNYTVEKHLQTSREEQRDTVRLDIARDAAVSYLRVLRTKTTERVQKENLRLTRANLDRARVRVAAGIASRAEEFRWESEIATSRQDVLRAQARRQQAETNLNRLLNRPLEEPFLTEETDLRDPKLLASDTRFFAYVDNPRNFNIFRDFLVEEGLEAAPELKRFNAAIAAQERVLVSAKRAFWLPTFSIEGNVTELFAESGEGQRSDSLFGLNNTDWSVGAFATFPLVEGGNKFATIKRASEQLSGLRVDREATAERIDERIRVTFDETGFSYPSIRLSREGAEAARKNLELVTDQYVRGVVSIIDLLDAQNNALVAEEDAQNAVFNFLIDLMNVQRATGKFDFFLSSQEREAWFQRLETFFRKRGVTPGRR
jgi:outer membrane protein TolC